VPWSPRTPSLDFGSSDQPLVYVTLGSSGDMAALPTVLAGLADLPFRGVLATAGRAAPQLPANFMAADYLPGDALAARARFVVTNGGSSTGYQALAAGVPVLGIPSNLDQYLAMQAIVQRGAGIMLRSGGLTRDEVRKAAVRLLDAPAAQRQATELARQFAAYDCHQRFQSWLRAQLAPNQQVMS
jgi:UDP:flavonoid glycosyltransferase YjiC (YdhE family)